MLPLKGGQLLHPFNVLLEHDHVVRVLLRCHVDAQVTSYIRLVIANVTAPRRFGNAAAAPAERTSRSVEPRLWESRTGHCRRT